MQSLTADTTHKMSLGQVAELRFTTACTPLFFAIHGLEMTDEEAWPVFYLQFSKALKEPPCVKLLSQDYSYFLKKR